jgi:hypothetical protein
VIARVTILKEVRATIDHDAIRRWVEERGGWPGCFAESDDVCVHLPGSAEPLEPITWDAFFRAFEEHQLAFVHEQELCAVVSRTSAGLQLDAVALLERQHRDLQALVDSLDHGGPAELFDRFAERLALHMEMEEQLFYPAVRTAETEARLREALDEHLDAKRLLFELIETPPESPTWRTRLHVLDELVRRHVAAEETFVLPTVRQYVAAERLRVLAAQMAAWVASLDEDEPVGDARM